METATCCFPGIFKQLKKMNYQEAEPGVRNQRQGPDARDAAVVQLHAGRPRRTRGSLTHIRMSNIPIGTKGEKKILVTSEVSIDFPGQEAARVLPPRT